MGAGAAGCRADQQPTPRSGAVPQRIVTIAPNAAEIIAALDQADRIVGVSTFCIYPPELTDRPRVGGLMDPNLERILSLQPDLVVLRGRSAPTESMCRDNGIDVFLDRTETMDDVFKTVQSLGDLLGVPDRARQINAERRAQLAAIEQRVAARPRPRVFLTVARNPSSLANLATAGKGVFLDEVIRLAGGENVFGRLDVPYPSIGPEAILGAQPEVIIEAMPETDLTPELRNHVRAQWRSLGPMPAVEHDRIYVLPDDNALIPSPRIVDTIQRVADLLHPQRDDDAA